MKILEALKDQLAKIYNPFYMGAGAKRVEEAVLQIDAGNWSKLGELLYDTHNGLKNPYEVSCKELNYLVELTKPIKEVYGARMMGVVLVVAHQFSQKEAVENVVIQVLDAYNTKFKVPYTPIILQ